MKCQSIAGIIFLITVFFVINNKGMAMAENPYSYYRERLKKVNVSDGVSKEEAIIIAQNYVIDTLEEGNSFYKKLVVSKASIFEEWGTEKDWAIIVPIRRGFAFIGPTEYILFVHKMTGRVIAGGERK